MALMNYFAFMVMSTPQSRVKHQLLDIQGISDILQHHVTLTFVVLSEITQFICSTYSNKQSKVYHTKVRW